MFKRDQEVDSPLVSLQSKVLILTGMTQTVFKRDQKVDNPSVPLSFTCFNSHTDDVNYV